jgi:hypothetical protein
MSEALALEFKRLQQTNLVKGAPTPMIEEMYDELPDGFSGDASEDDEGGFFANLIYQEFHRRKGLENLRQRGGSVAEPEIVVDKDFDGHFERLVRGWIAEHQQAGGKFLHQTIKITAGPYRAQAVAIDSNGIDTVALDFYSAIRNGFGSLSSREIDNIKKCWL